MFLPLPRAKSLVCPFMSKPISVQSSSDDWDFCLGDGCIAWSVGSDDTCGFCRLLPFNESDDFLSIYFNDFLTKKD